MTKDNALERDITLWKTALMVSVNDDDDQHQFR
ncbi:hypothetical protein AF72_07840 [Xylella taiwanensis]|uniref:Uncharacterized protein n=1 Tax=Xylella taiwanensis TaxID=1444770 RepID=Z9JI63_9GAMM|nr:hypothetical protein AF72_07840 [Xylella taiwanensis]